MFPRGFSAAVEGQADVSLHSNFCSVDSSSCFMSNANSVYAHLPFNAINSKFAVSGHGLYDSGSTHSLIPSCQLPQAILDALEPTGQDFGGITNERTQALGMFNASLHLGGFVFQNVQFYVMPTACPVILGQNILSVVYFSHSKLY